MTPSLDTSSQLDQKLAELKETQEREKVELSPEVEKYYQEHVKAIQGKLAKGEAILESDLKFIDDVKLWMSLPEEWREQYSSVEEMKKAGEANDIELKMKGILFRDLQEATQEAQKRNINLKQWLTLLHIANTAGKERSWIDETFDFKDGDILGVELNLSGSTKLAALPESLKLSFMLYLDKCTNLAALPKGLKVDNTISLSDCTKLPTLPEGLEGSAIHLIGCTSLTSLPAGIKVQQLFLNGCTSLSSIPNDLKVENALDVKGCTSLTSLPEGMDVGRYLILDGCTSLTSLPKDLEISGNLSLEGCVKLTSLPGGLKVGWYLDLRDCINLNSLPDDLSADELILSNNLNDQVKKDAKRLYENSDIEKITYR